MPKADSVTTDGTNVLAGADADARTAGLYQITPSGQGSESLPLRYKPYAVGTPTFSLGHVYYSDNSALSHPWFTRSISGDAASVIVGGEQRLNFWPWNSVASGDRIAFSQLISGKWHVRVMRKGRLERDFVTPGKAFLQMSGPLLLMKATGIDSTGWWVKLGDASTGSSPAFLPLKAALRYGDSRLSSSTSRRTTCGAATSRNPCRARTRSFS